MKTNLRQIKSAALEMIEVTEEQIIQLPGGIPGFPEFTEGALVGAAADGSFWLQNTKAEAPTILLADPFKLVPGYSLEIADDVAEALGRPTPQDLLIVCAVKIPQAAGEMPTVNLVAPFAFNLTKRIGRQLIRSDDFYTARHPIPLSALLPEDLAPEVRAELSEAAASAVESAFSR